jgi:hypothetical protein
VRLLGLVFGLVVVLISLNSSSTTSPLHQANRAPAPTLPSLHCSMETSDARARRSATTLPKCGRRNAGVQGVPTRHLLCRQTGRPLATRGGTNAIVGELRTLDAAETQAGGGRMTPIHPVGQPDIRGCPGAGNCQLFDSLANNCSRAMVKADKKRERKARSKGGRTNVKRSRRARDAQAEGPS